MTESICEQSSFEESSFAFECPKKSDYRQRAHCNPLSDPKFAKPPSPDHVDWNLLYPLINGSQYKQTLPVNCSNMPASYDCDLSLVTPHASRSIRPSMLDIGCGFGRFLIKLAEMYPTERVLGFEIRDKVSEFVARRIASQRVPNAAIVRTNCMKYISHYLERGSLSKIFICFPDPHFKRSNWRRRIVNPSTVCDYAYLLGKGASLYFISDVQDWVEHAMTVMAGTRIAKLFECVFYSLDSKYGAPEDADRMLLDAMQNETDEALKVKRGSASTYSAIFRRI